MPTEQPTMAASASGVSRTRSVPKRSCNPSVARNTPPFFPMSWPNRMTSGSSCIAFARARFTAWTKVTLSMGPTSLVQGDPLGKDLLALRCQGIRDICIHVGEHLVGTQVAGDFLRFSRRDLEAPVELDDHGLTISSAKQAFLDQ